MWKQCSRLRKAPNKNLTTKFIDSPQFWLMKIIRSNVIFRLYVMFAMYKMMSMFVLCTVCVFVWTNNQRASIHISPENKLLMLDVTGNNFTNLSQLFGIMSMRELFYLNLMHNGFRSIDFTEICKNRQNTLEIEYILSIFLSSDDLNSEQQSEVINDCKPNQINMYINVNDHRQIMDGLIPPPSYSLFPNRIWTLEQ